MEPLTPKQQKLYEFINDRSNWVPPTWAQMMRFMGLRSNNSISEYLKQIRRKGYNLPFKQYEPETITKAHQTGEES